MGASKSKGIERFIDAQSKEYKIAYKEISEGKKESHWIWYIYPQIQGLGMSYMDREYSIKSIKETLAYIDNNILFNRLNEMTKLLIKIEHNNIKEVMWYPDDLKLRSCMTLFYAVSGKNIFEKVIDKFYEGEKDLKTIDILIKMFSKEKLNLEEKFCKEFEKRIYKMEKEEKIKLEKRIKLEKELKLKKMKEKDEEREKLQEKNEEKIKKENINTKEQNKDEDNQISIDDKKLKSNIENNNKADNKALSKEEPMDLDEKIISDKNDTKRNEENINKEISEQGEKV